MDVDQQLYALNSVLKDLPNYKKYYEILINIDLSNYNDKNIMTITIVKEKTTIFNKLIKKLKGW